MGFACGRYGIGCGRCGLWPISSVADMVVADMVCGRYRRNSSRILQEIIFMLWRNA